MWPSEGVLTNEGLFEISKVERGSRCRQRHEAGLGEAGQGLHGLICKFLPFMCGIDAHSIADLVE